MGGGRGLTLLPLLAYPFVVHFSIVSGAHLPLFIVLGLMLGLLLLRLPLPPLVRAALVLIATASLAAAAAVPVVGQQLPLFAPLLVFLVLAWVFGVTLLPQSRPLVTRIAAALGDPLDAALLRYTRQVTVAWVALFLLLATLTLLLWWWVPRVWWSLFTNFIAYGLVALMFAVEYGVRRRRFAFARERGFVGFMRALARIAPQELWR